MENEKIISLLSNPEVISELKKLKSGEEVINYFKQKEIEPLPTLEKAETVIKFLSAVDEYNGKLSDEQMSEIAGGIDNASVGKIIGWITLGIGVTALVAGAGKFGYDVYNEVNNRGTFIGGIVGEISDTPTDIGLTKATLYERLVKKTARSIISSQKKDSDNLF